MKSHTDVASSSARLRPQGDLVSMVLRTRELGDHLTLLLSNGPSSNHVKD